MHACETNHKGEFVESDRISLRIADTSYRGDGLKEAI